MSIIRNHELRDGQSASNRVIVKSDNRRTRIDRSSGDPLRPVLDLNPTPPWPSWHRPGNRCNIGDASRASTTLRDDTEPTNRLIDWRTAPTSCLDECSLLLPVLVNFIANRSPMESRRQCNFLLVTIFVSRPCAFLFVSLRSSATRCNLAERLVECLYFGFIEGILNPRDPTGSLELPRGSYLSTKSSSRASRRAFKCIANGKRRSKMRRRWAGSELPIAPQRERIGGRRRAKTNLRLSGRFIGKDSRSSVHRSVFTKLIGVRNPVRKIFRKLSVSKRSRFSRKNTIAKINSECIILNTEIPSTYNRRQCTSCSVLIYKSAFSRKI